MMFASLRAELLKTSKRPAARVIAVVLVAYLLLFFYAALYALVRLAPPEALEGGPDPAMFLDLLLPSGAAVSMVSNVASFGGALGLVLGALLAGSEYGWRTIRTIAVQRPSRAQLLSGKLLAGVLLALVLTVLGSAAVIAGSELVALLEGGPYTLPSAGDLLRALGIAWLAMTVWVELGVALGVVVRSSGLAIGIGLVYALVLESVFAIIPPTVPGISAIQRATIGTNTNALTATLEGGTDLTAGFGMSAVADIGWAAAVTVLLAYIVVSAAGALIVFERRELG